MSGSTPRDPLDRNATIVGEVVELRYGSHGEAVRELHKLRELLRQREQLMQAARQLLRAASPYMTHRNAREREAYKLMRDAIGDDA